MHSGCPTSDRQMIAKPLGWQCLRLHKQHSMRCRAVQPRAASSAERRAGRTEQRQAEDRRTEYRVPKDNHVPISAEYIRQLEESVPHDEEIAELLRGANRDPVIIEQRMRESMARKNQQIMLSERTGSDKPMKVEFRMVDPFDLWIWFEMPKPPSNREQGLLQEVVSSWFMLGRLGGFNAANLQVFHNTGRETSFMTYDIRECESLVESTFHDISPVEAKGSWCRFWVNLGVGDEMCLDILINALSNFSIEHVAISKLVVGGKNKDWETPADSQNMLEGMEETLAAGGDISKNLDPNDDDDDDDDNNDDDDLLY